MNDAGGVALRQRGGIAVLATVLAASLGCEELLGLGADGGVDGGDGQGGAGGATSGPGCGLPDEPEPNDNRNQAVAYREGTSVTGCMVSGDDVDFYELQTPSGAPAGGYFEVSLTDVGAGRIEAKLTSATDNGQIHRIFTDDAGSSKFFYFAAAPGQKYRIAVASLPPFLAEYRYTLLARYTEIADPYEPNDTRESAKPIMPGGATSAFLFAGHRSANISGDDFKDWYSFNLAAGMVNIKITDVPTNVRVEAFLYDANSNKVDAPTMSNANFGGSFDVNVAIAKAGAYRLELGAFPPAPLPYGNGTTLPDNFTRPYRLSVLPR